MKMYMRKVCVLGLGYIGLPTAAMFATNGLKVVGVDVNRRILNTLNQGGIHIQENGLEPLVHQALSSGALRVVPQPEQADAFIIAVPTPFQENGEPENGDGEQLEPAYKHADMRFVISATEAIVPYLQPGNLVVLESTSPPRTTIDLVRPILERSGLKAGRDFFLAYSPERVLPGQIIKELVENARVIGGIDRASAEVGKELYGTFVKGEIVLTDATTAEMVKLMENTYRDVNIAIANEFARLADRFGVNVWEAIQVANLHPRVKILSPGPGVGGHCISVDPWFLVEAAPDLTHLICTARKVNDGQPSFILKLVQRAVGHLEGKRITVLGLTYKQDVDDIRESPAIEVTRLLSMAGAHVKAFEPYKPDASIPGVTTTNNIETALADAEIVLLLVGHRQFRQLNPAQLAALTPARLLVDAINAWNQIEWEAAGFHVVGIGKQAELPV